MVEECVLHWVDDKPVPRDELLEFLRGAALTMLPDALMLGPALARRDRSVSPEAPPACR